MQPIAAARAGTHAEVVTAVALASLLAMLATPDDPAWEAWLRARWTKTVRRGTGPQLEAAAPFAATLVQVGDARAYGFVPVTYADLPPPLSKMQVALFERPRDGDLADPGAGPVITISPMVEMSTGKAAAQAAHGIYRWWVGLRAPHRERWVDQGHPVWVRTELPKAQWRGVVDGADGVVNDAGLTETEPGALTVAVRGR